MHQLDSITPLVDNNKPSAESDYLLETFEYIFLLKGKTAWLYG